MKRLAPITFLFSVALFWAYLEAGDLHRQIGTAPQTKTAYTESLPINSLSAGDRFGASVAIYGTTAAVGAPFMDELWGADSGAVVIYYRGSDKSWTQADTLIQLNGSPDDHFGVAVDLGLDLLVVGAPVEDTDGTMTGAEFVFEKTQTLPSFWFQRKRLVGSDSVDGDLFGYAVAIAGDTVIVGAQGADGGIGAAYIFSRDKGGTDNWGQVRKLVPSDGTGGLFGGAVAISGSVAMVGAGEYPGGGAVYVFGRNTDGTDMWGQADRIHATGGSTNEAFGSSVALSSRFVDPFIYTYALIGAPFAGKDLGQGAAYVFRAGFLSTSFSQKARLQPGGSTNDEVFGRSVDLSWDLAVLSAGPEVITGNEDPGSAYLFEVATSGVATELGRFIPPAWVSGDLVGAAVSVSNGTALVGAPGVNTDAGRTYVLDYLIFSDGFESGDLTAWSATSP